ncbi:MAG: TonB-dependent siderophore receptor [Oceanospirillales bacterium]|nr:TonB-dependent siderophore receptor [Oceanospirillales bacterium]
MFTRCRLSTAITLLTAASALAGSVQADQSTMTQDTVVITATQGATKVETPLVETPQAVSVISREEFERRAPQSVQRATNYTPGIFTNQVGASNRYDYLVLRGFSDGSIGNTYLDGLKLMGDTNSYSAVVIDPWFLDSIEVVRGPASVLYGRASPGGLVALNSRKPVFTRGGEIRGTAGGNSQRSLAFDLTGPVSKAQGLAFRLGGIVSVADTQFGPVEEERRVLKGDLTWRLSDATTLELLAYLHDEPEGGYHSGLPYEGTVVDRNGRRISNTFFEGEEDYDKFDRAQQLFGYSVEHHFNDRWTFRQKARHLSSDVENSQLYAYGWANANELTRYYSGGEENLSAWTLDNQLEGVLAHGDTEHRLLIGLDYQYRNNDVSWLSGAFTNINPFNPVYGSEPTALWPPHLEEHRLKQTGFYLHDQISHGNWHFALGGRYDQVKIRNEQLAYGVVSELDESQLSGRLAALYFMDNGLAPYASYSIGFTPTSFVDANGNLLQPMEGKQVEVGLKYEPIGSNSQYSAALFHITQTNIATKEQPTDPYRAIGEIESQGLEFEARTELSPKATFRAGYSYTDATYSESDDGNQGNDVVYSPKHQASFWLDYRLNALTSSVGLRHYRDIQADRANTHTLPSYTLMDLALHYDLGQMGDGSAYAQLNVNNLFDKEYVASCNSLEFCYFGAKRSIKASFGYKF